MSDTDRDPPRPAGQSSEATGTGWMSVLLLAVVVLGVSLLSLAARPAASLLAHPLLEDAYYALTIARNIADGQGMTIDGQQLTSGFQPLFTLVEAVPFLGSWGDVASIRLITLIQVLVLALAGILMGLIVRDQLRLTGRAGFVAAVGGLLVFVASFFTINTALNGLETGALMLAYAATWRYMQSRELSRAREFTTLGVLLGVTILVRVDAAVVVICVLVAVAVATGLKRAAVVGIVAAAVSAPWFLYNLTVFGTLMPSGGSAQTDVDPSWFRTWQMLEAWSAALMPWLPLSRFSATGAVLIRLAVILVVVVLLIRSRALVPRDARARRALLFAAALLSGYLVLAGFYSTTSYAIWFYGRYMAPVVLVASFAVSLLLLRRITRIRVAVLIGLAVVGCAVALLHWSGSFYLRNEMFDDQVPLVLSVVPESAVVSAGQTGTLGFFRDRVVNLDGKVNPEALANARDIPGYLSREGIDWFCDWPSNVERHLGAAHPGWVEVAHRGGFACLTRVPSN